MMRYGYKGYDANGGTTAGEIVAESREAALEALHRRGEFPLEIFTGSVRRGQPWWNRDIFLLRRPTMSMRSLALFTRELAMLVKADLPLDEALRIVALQPLLPATVKRTTQAVLARVMEGHSLSQALAAEGDTVPEYVWRLIRGGEASGALGEVLDDLAGFLERSAEVRAKVFSALLYPMILMGVAGLTLAVIMGVLLPMVVPLLKDAGAPLPFIIRVLEGVRETVAGNWLAAMVLGGAGIMLAVALPRAPAVRAVVSRAVLRVPLVNRLIIGREVARFTRTLGTLVKSGVPLLEATRIAGGVLGNAAYRQAIETVTAELKEGASLSRPLTASGLFPELALRLVAVGEQTGQLEAMLLRTATIFETALQRQLDRITTLLTPVLTIGIGIFVGGLMVSVMGALLSINELALQ